MTLLESGTVTKKSPDYKGVFMSEFVCAHLSAAGTIDTVLIRKVP